MSPRQPRRAGLKIHERGGGGAAPGCPGRWSSLLGAVALGGERITGGFFDRAARHHPRLAHVRLGPEHVYLLNSPDLVHDILVRQAGSTMKGRAIQATRQLLGDGLLTSEGKQHRTSPTPLAARLLSSPESPRTPRTWHPSPRN